MDSAVDLVPLFRREFELCRVQEGEVVALLTEPATRRDYVSAAAAAAGTLGADVFELCVKGLGWSVPTPIKGMGASVPALARSSPLLDAVKASLSRAQFVVDLIPETIIHVPIRGELQSAGARILTVIEAPDILERLFPPEGIKESVVAMAERLERASRLIVRSPSGTDLSYSLEGVPCLVQYGYADEPGHWDHWPSALAVAYPVDRSAEGRVVLTPGDIVYPFKRLVEAPVTMEISKGYVVGIEGGLDAHLIRDYLESWNNPEVFATSHIGFGMLPGARWSALAFYDKVDVMGMDGRSVLGNFLFSTGPNRYTGRLVEAHLDIPMRGCTVYLDDEPVIVNGRSVTDAGVPA
jgi:2,5-dihydroxypyridine 5,6-dioxygenase